MSYPIGRQESYDSLLPYLPEDAKAILYKEIPNIRQRIDSEVDTFVAHLSSQLQAELDEESKSIEAESLKAIQELDSILAAITAARGDGVAMAAAAANLKTAISSYQDKWENMGKTVRKLALTAARSYGLPIPG